MITKYDLEQNRDKLSQFVMDAIFEHKSTTEYKIAEKAREYYLKHNPEFTMMECYQAYGNMESVLELAEEVITNAAHQFYPDLQVPYQGKTINLSRPWKRASMLQLVRDVTGCQELTYSSSREQVAELAKKLNVEIEDKDTAVKIMGKIFDEKIEATLIEPTFVVEYPFGNPITVHIFRLSFTNSFAIASK